MDDNAEPLAIFGAPVKFVSAEWLPQCDWKFGPLSAIGAKRPPKQPPESDDMPEANSAAK